MRNWLKNRTRLLPIVLLIIVSACGNNHDEPEKTSALIPSVKKSVVCDTAAMDVPPINKHSVTMKVWLEDISLEWFLDKRQSAWRQAKAWNNKVISIDSNTVLNCAAAERKELFLYIPNRFYKKEKNGSDYFQFFIANNSADTVMLPMIDAVVNHISSSVRINKNDSISDWLLFQQTTKVVICGNSLFTMKLPPRMAVQAEIESDFLNLGSAPADYRIELDLNGKKIISNNIGIHLMPEQLPFLGKNF